MKRHHDRDGRSRSKRSRSSYDRMHDDDGPRLSRSPEFDRRESSGRSRRDIDYDYEPSRKSYREERSIKDSYSSEGRTPSYRSLCIFNFSRKIPDHVIKDALGHEFHKFGEFNIKVQNNNEDKVAYLNFRYPDDAKIAKHTVGKTKLILFNVPVRIDSVYNKRRSASPPPRSPPHRSPPPRSPPPDHRDRRDLYMPHGPISPPLRPPMPPPPGRGPPHPPMPPMPPPPPGRHMGPPPPNMGRDFGPPGPPPPGPPHLQGPPGPPPHHHPHPRDFPGPGFPPERRPPGTEKFPFHLNHVDPEDDEKATRTLFIGNLDINIDEDELRHIFEKFGYIEEIDIKRPVRGAGNAYCFMKYINLDCAHRAKVEMSGKLIGRFQCKIGYGKATPTNCLWVGGLGPWVTREMLECEFDRFGVINTIDWQPGKSYAYLLYDSNDAASAAIQDMRGFPMGGPDRRLRVDFTDAGHIHNMPGRMPPGPPRGEPFPPRNFPGPHVPPPPGPPGPGPWRGPHPPPPPPGLPPPRDWHGPGREPPPYRRPDNPRPFDRRGPPEPPDMHSRRPRSPDNSDRDRRNVDRSKGSDSHESEIKRGHEQSMQNGKPKIEVEPSTLNVDNIGDLSTALPVAWNGAMILKNNAFPARMHVVSGDVSIVDNLMRDPTSTETPVLKVTQRLRLDPPKLEDVRRRVNSGIPSGHCILLALPGTLLNYDDPSGNTQQRPLKNLISYLNKKEAAGVISLPPNPSKDNKDNVGILYSFPPSPFGQSFLQKKAPRLPSTPSKEDHLVVVVVRGAV